MIWIPVALAGVALLWFLLRRGRGTGDGSYSGPYSDSGGSVTDSGGTATPFPLNSADNGGHGGDPAPDGNVSDPGGTSDGGGWDLGGSGGCDSGGDSGGGDSGGGDSGGGGGGD